ncbi:MAG: hypothetical protein LBU61_06520 [Coriobacteriales bacterium]|jgi:hypothetical protein|nr:hypothetical protein [Coriobacteriales bacterium]
MGIKHILGFFHCLVLSIILVGCTSQTVDDPIQGSLQLIPPSNDTTVISRPFPNSIIPGVPSFVSSPKTLLQDASPSTSALTLYVYDGEKTWVAICYDDVVVNEILDNLNSVIAIEAPGWSLKDITLPLYGLEIGRADGWSIQAAWSNGYWIAQDGKAYNFDFDFRHLRTDYTWSNASEYLGINNMPCASLLTKDTNGWNRSYMTPAHIIAPAENISVAIKTWGQSRLDLQITNTGLAEWSFGEVYELQVYLDNMWYVVPKIPGNWAFNLPLYTLPAAHSLDKAYDLGWYGNLPVGTYRLVVENTWVDFRIE